MFSLLSVDESLQPGLDGPSARDAVKDPVGTFPPLVGFEALGAGQLEAVGVEQLETVLGVGQEVKKVASSTGILISASAADPTPGADRRDAGKFSKCSGKPVAAC